MMWSWFSFSMVIGVFLIFGGMVLYYVSFFVSSVLFHYYLLSSVGVELSFSFFVDGVGAVFIGTVFLISGSVVIYSLWYMDGEVFFSRFLLIVLAFVLSMVLLIMIPNLVVLLIGWDGLGLTSFLLVVYYHNSKALGAGMITALSNRIGDVLLLVSLGALFNEGSWLLYGGPFLYWWYGGLGFMLVIGSVTKSAQIPFCAWLPAAMSAPTPVSSLVHSSTLVTAGVYLLLRVYSVLVMSEGSLELLKGVSLLTLLLAGMGASVEVDVKKVVALSTLSQLSMMLFALSLGLVNVCFFHLVSHASFKALLFLCVGAVIHLNNGVQDLRCLGLCPLGMPFSVGGLGVSSLSLCGIPFMSGFYSKDLIVELSLCAGDNMFIYFLEFVGLLFTSWYSVRLMLGLTLGLAKGMVCSGFWLESYTLLYSYIGLLVSSVAGGSVLVVLLEGVNYSLVLFGVDKGFVLCSLALGAFLFFVFMNFLSLWGGVSHFLMGMFNFKFISGGPISEKVLSFAGYTVSIVESGWLEYGGPQGLFSMLGCMSMLNQKYQGNYFVNALGVLCLLVLLLGVFSMAFSVF